MTVKPNALITYVKTFLIATILMVTASPILWIISHGNREWILLSSIIWAGGTLIVFYPFVEHLYPKMITKTGLFLLTSILIVVASWFNITLISFLLPQSYIFNALINTTIHQISLLGSLYIVIANSIISKLRLSDETRSFSD